MYSTVNKPSHFGRVDLNSHFDKMMNWKLLTDINYHCLPFIQAYKEIITNHHWKSEDDFE